MNSDIEQLQIKLAYLESANAELSDVVYRQQKEIDALRERLGQLLNRVDELANKPRDWTAAEEKPPHY